MVLEENATVQKFENVKKNRMPHRFRILYPEAMKNLYLEILKYIEQGSVNEKGNAN